MTYAVDTAYFAWGPRFGLPFTCLVEALTVETHHSTRQKGSGVSNCWCPEVALGTRWVSGCLSWLPDGLFHLHFPPSGGNTQLHKPFFLIRVLCAS